MPAYRFAAFSILFLSFFISLPFAYSEDDDRDLVDILPRLIEPGESISIELTDDELDRLQIEGREIAADIFSDEFGPILPATIERFIEEFDRLIQPASLELLETAAYISFLRRRAIQAQVLNMRQLGDDQTLEKILDAIKLANRIGALLDMIEAVNYQQQILHENLNQTSINLYLIGGAATLTIVQNTAIIYGTFERQISLQRELHDLLQSRHSPGSIAPYIDELHELTLSREPIDTDIYDRRQQEIRELFDREFFDDEKPQPRKIVSSEKVLQKTGSRHLTGMRRRAQPLLDFLREHNIFWNGDGKPAAEELVDLFKAPEKSYPRTYADLSSDLIVRAHRIDYALTQASDSLNAFLPNAIGDERVAIQQAHKSLEVLRNRNRHFRRWTTGKFGPRGQMVAGVAIFSEIAVFGFLMSHLIELRSEDLKWEIVDNERIENFEAEVEAFRKTGRKSTEDLHRTLEKLNAEITGLQQLWQEAGRKSIDWPEIPPVLDLDRAMFELL